MHCTYVCMYVCMYVCNLIRWIPSGSFRSCLRMWTCARSVRWRRSSSPCCSCPGDPSTDKVRLTHTYFFLIIKSMYVCIHVCMYVGCRFTKRGLDENGNAANFVVCYCMYVCMHVFNCLILYVCMYVSGNRADSNLSGRTNLCFRSDSRLHSSQVVFTSTHEVRAYTYMQTNFSLHSYIHTYIRQV